MARFCFAIVAYPQPQCGGVSAVEAVWTTPASLLVSEGTAEVKMWFRRRPTLSDVWERAKMRWSYLLIVHGTCLPERQGPTLPTCPTCHRLSEFFTGSLIIHHARQHNRRADAARAPLIANPTSIHSARAARPSLGKARGDHGPRDGSASITTSVRELAGSCMTGGTGEINVNTLVYFFETLPFQNLSLYTAMYADPTIITAQSLYLQPNRKAATSNQP
jgi:hypothetical protein